MKPAKLPDSFLDIIQDSNDKMESENKKKEFGNIIHQGERNAQLTSIAGILRRIGFDYDEIYDVLSRMNHNRCNPALEKAEVRKVAQSVSKYKPSSSYSLSDVGNSKWFVQSTRQFARYCFEKKAWYIWNGQFWEEDLSNQIMKYAQMAIQLLQEMVSQAQKQDLRNKIRRHIEKSEQISRLRAMIELSKTDLSIKINDFDKDKWLFNCSNGTINLRTGELQPHNQDDFITRMVQIEYDPNLECPGWMTFLNRVLNESPDLILFVQRAVGYCLTGDISEQVFFLLIGLGANGKTTFLSILLKLLGKYGKQTDFNTFLLKNNSSIRNDLARLKGSRLVIATEVDTGKRLSESVIKQVTGGDRITARFLFREYFEFQPTFKIFLAANHKPTIRGTEHAIWRRIRLVPFSVIIPEAERDPNLIDSLSKELPGILAWAVRGCLDWKDNGLGYPQEVEEATNEYRNEMDIVGDFLAEGFIVEPGNDDLCILANRLYRLYQLWCESNYEERIKKHLFNKLIQEHGFIKRRSTSGSDRGCVHWFGICETRPQPQGAAVDVGV